MAVVGIVPAAGSGERLGADGPKAFVVCAGKPLVEWSLDVLAEVCDRVVVVASSPHIQLKRLLERKRIDSSAAEEMIKSQMPLTEKISRADHVVWNNDGRFVLKEQAKLLVDLWREESWTKT